MNIAIFASGAGSNAEVIIKTLHTFLGKQKASVSLIISNNESAGVLNIATNNFIPFEVLDFKNVLPQNIPSAYLNS